MDLSYLFGCSQSMKESTITFTPLHQRAFSETFQFVIFFLHSEPLTFRMISCKYFNLKRVQTVRKCKISVNWCFVTQHLKAFSWHFLNAKITFKHHKAPFLLHWKRNPENSPDNFLTASLPPVLDVKCVPLLVSNQSLSLYESGYIRFHSGLSTLN